MQGAAAVAGGGLFPRARACRRVGMAQLRLEVDWNYNTALAPFPLGTEVPVLESGETHKTTGISGVRAGEASRHSHQVPSVANRPCELRAGTAVLELPGRSPRKGELMVRDSLAELIKEPRKSSMFCKKKVWGEQSW